MWQPNIYRIEGRTIELGFNAGETIGQKVGTVVVEIPDYSTDQLKKNQIQTINWYYPSWNPRPGQTDFKLKSLRLGSEFW